MRARVKMYIQTATPFGQSLVPAGRQRRDDGEDARGLRLDGVKQHTLDQITQGWQGAGRWRTRLSRRAASLGKEGVNSIEGSLRIRVADVTHASKNPMQSDQRTSL